MIRITDILVLDDREIDERFVRAAGPGGQNVNKVATAVELRFDVGRSALPPNVKGRLVTLAGRNMTTDGVLIMVSRVHRSQDRNRDAAHARLVALLKRAATPPKKRTATKPRPVVRERRLLSKKRHSAVKGTRRKPAED